MTPSTEANIDLAARLRLSVVRTARRLRQEAGTDVSPSQTAALATIERHGPLTPSELAKIESIKRPTATQVIARLEAAGFADRTRDPADGRSSLVSVTREGSELLRRLRSRKNAYLARRLRDLPAEDLAALDRAADVLERMLEDGRK
jgi:DNA-binding MarR family transcriptional regulator